MKTRAQEQLEQGPLEVRQLYCPRCKALQEISVYLNDQPIRVECLSCQAAYWFNFQRETLYDEATQDACPDVSFLRVE